MVAAALKKVLCFIWKKNEEVYKYGRLALPTRQHKLSVTLCLLFVMPDFPLKNWQTNENFPLKNWQINEIIPLKNWQRFDKFRLKNWQSHSESKKKET